MTNTRYLLTGIGLANGLGAFALSYSESGFMIAQPWRFILALGVAGTGFLLIQMRSWQDASKSPELPLDSTPPYARPPGDSRPPPH